MPASDDIIERIKALLGKMGPSPCRRDVTLAVFKEPKNLTKSLPLDAVIITDAWVFDNLIKPLSLPQQVFTIPNEDSKEGDKIVGQIKRGTTVIGFGGGRPNDIAKYVANKTGSELIIIPTSPSNDGISSGVSALLIDGRKTSVKTKRPNIVILYYPYWEKSPDALIKSGVCDVIAKLTSLQDAYLSMGRGEDVDPKSLYFSLQSIEKILEYKQGDFTVLADALLLCGESMKESSRAASGSEHEVEKLLTSLGFKQPHGQLVALGTLISARMYQDHAKDLPSNLFLDNSRIYDTVRSLFREMGLLDYALEPLKKLTPDELKKLCEDLLRVSTVRPERYTIWQKYHSETIDWLRLLKDVLSSI